MKYQDIAKRMKGYENISRNYLTRKLPVIIRVDGKAFHTFTRGMKKPFDRILMDTMCATAQSLCENIQGCKIAYVQSDEISLLLTDYETITTDAWFGYNIQKMTSISASIATLAFNSYFMERVKITMMNEDLLTIYQTKYNKAMFDSRVFTLPHSEICNYFIWRQQDATRNAIQMVGRANFSDKQLYRHNCKMIQEKLFQEKGINFNDIHPSKKRGICVIKEQYDKEGTQRTHWIPDDNIPIFTQDRNYIDKYICKKDEYGNIKSL